MLLGYPVEFVKDADQGRMHATVPFNVSFRQVMNHVFATSDITSYAGNSGGPVCVQADDGRYYPAAIYLGGSAQTVVRAIDSSVADLINRAEISAGGGPNNVGGGVGWVPGSGGASLFAPGYLQVLIQPTQALVAGGGWRLVGSGQTNYVNDNAASYGLLPATYEVEFRPAEGFSTPTNRPVTIVADQTAVLPIEYIVGPPGLTAWLDQPEQRLRLRLTGVSGLGYLIEASTNLLAWGPLATNLSLANGQWEIADSNPANLRWRFYRARSLPSL
jgi:hypothetical protein